MEVEIPEHILKKLKRINKKTGKELRRNWMK